MKIKVHESSASDYTLLDIFENFQSQLQVLANKYSGHRGHAVYQDIREMSNGNLTYDEAKKIYDGLVVSKGDMDALFDEVLDSMSKNWPELKK